MAVATMTKTKVVKKVSTLAPVKSVIDSAKADYARKIHIRAFFFTQLCEAITESVEGWGYKSGDTSKVDPDSIAFLATEVMNAYMHMRMYEYYGQSIDSWINDISPEDVLVWAMERPEWPIMVDAANKRFNNYDPYSQTTEFIRGCNCKACFDYAKGVRDDDPTLFGEECPCQQCAV